jgi:tryptophan synthase beta chain
LYQSVTDRDALAAFAALARLEGIIPALESAHAVAWVLAQRGTRRWTEGDVVLINLSGRGDKDVAHVAELTGAAL